MCIRDSYDIDDQLIDALARGQAPAGDPVGQLLSSWAAPIQADALHAACLLYTSRCV